MAVTDSTLLETVRKINNMFHNAGFHLQVSTVLWDASYGTPSKPKGLHQGVKHHTHLALKFFNRHPEICNDKRQVELFFQSWLLFSALNMLAIILLWVSLVQLSFFFSELIKELCNWQLTLSCSCSEMGGEKMMPDFEEKPVCAYSIVAIG